MSTIKLFTVINAPITVCFNLARNIDVHQHTTLQTNEKAIAGRTEGLIEQGETVTWEAKHFGIKQQLSVEITEMEFPVHFKDVMLKGAFKSMVHTHGFEQQGDTITLMKDVFTYDTPYGAFGMLFNSLVLEKYMTGFLKNRNAVLKQLAESGEWKKYFD